MVNVISRPPSDDPELRFGTRFGDFEERQVQFSVSDSLVPDTLGVRLAGVYSSNDGFTDNILLGNNADEQTGFAGRANLVWTPSDAWKVSLTAASSRTRDDASAYVSIDQDDPFEIVRSDNGEFDLDVDIQSLRVGYEENGFRFTSITARSDTDYDYIDFNDDFGTSSISDYAQEIISQEFRLQSPQDADQFQWIVGGFFQNRDFRIGDSFEAPFFGINSSVKLSEYDQTTYAAFAQVDYKPIEPLTLTAGLRYESWQEELNRNAEMLDTNAELFEFFGLPEPPPHRD